MKDVKNTIIHWAIGLALASGAGSALAERLTIDSRSPNSYLEATYFQMGMPGTGRFTSFKGELQLDKDLFHAQAFESLRGKIEVRTASWQSVNQAVDQQIKTPGFFSSLLYPKATFEFEGVEPLKIGDGFGWQATGPLTIKDQSHPVKIVFRVLEQTGQHAQLEGSFDLNRRLFKVGPEKFEGVAAIDDLVKVRFEVRAHLQ